MMAKILFVASVLSVISLVNAGAPSFVVPCLTSDEACITKNTKDGIKVFADGLPDYGVKVLDPLNFDYVDASSQNLKFILKGITLTGMKDCTPKKARRDGAKSTLEIQMSCPINTDGEYELSGDLLGLKIGGKGAIHVVIPKLEINLILDLVEKVGKDGEKHIRIKKFTHTYDLKDKSTVKFEGLFQESEVLSKAIDDLIANNGNEIIKEIGNPMIETAVTEVVENVNHFFGKVPTNELSLD